VASFSRIRKFTGFMTTLLACGAFLVGAVRVWGVDPDKMMSGLLMILVGVGLLLTLSFGFMLLIRVAKWWLNRN
jgi:uncharacterized membrane protein